MRSLDSGIYVNPSAYSWHHAPNIDSRILELHQLLPGFATTPLIPVDSVARELGFRRVFIKDESSRANLPAFKILGASWAAYRAVARAVDKPLGISLEDLSVAAREQGIKLFAATDGNHGRAVARMALILGVECDVFVPLNLDVPSRDLIASEGARVIVVHGDYDITVQEAKRASDVPNGMLIQDTAFEGYTEIAQWIVDGYSTMMVEAEEQVRQVTGATVGLAVVPVGVGSFAQCVVTYWKSRPYPCAVLAVEPDSAACLKDSLAKGVPTTVHTSDTIMSGLNCGTVSSIAWPILRKGLDASLAISDVEADKAVKELQSLGVNVGPCGAATYVALQIVARQDRETVGSLNSNSIVVLFCTEGKRLYKAPGA